MSGSLLLTRMKGLYPGVLSLHRMFSGIKNSDLKGNEDNDFSIDKDGNITVNIKNEKVKKALEDIIKDLQDKDIK
ncbi:TPA: hypothetical protein G8O67_004889 [Salmonella enterica]|uniref:Uncharacterized protein n=1 Tax=Salmonella enterica TaxID=28901 RepID=A0A756I5J0_SALER|nr:hypothetical protein [Salmonella enterica]